MVCGQRRGVPSGAISILNVSYLMCYGRTMTSLANVAQRSSRQATRAPGRPRRADVEEAVLDSAIELLAERGLSGTTMSAVVQRSGVARATVYLRWPNREALLTAAVRRAMGRPVIKTTGDIEADLRLAAEQLQAILRSGSFQALFPALVAAVTSRDPSARLSYDAVSPGVALVADEYRELAAGQGFRDDLPARLVIDAIVGSLIGYYLSAGEPPDDAARDAILDVALDGLRRR
jgi:AcrR family transcriptional regulator